MKIDGCKLRRARKQTAKSDSQLWQAPLLFIAFVCGAVFGSLTGTWQISASAAELVQIESGNIYGTSGFLELLFFCAKYHLCLLLLGTSLLGIVMIPATFVLRGFVLSCTAASIASSYPGSGLILTVVILGLPSLLTVPTLFIIGRDSFSFSARLLSLYDRRAVLPTENTMFSDLIVSSSALILAAAVEYSLVPKLVDILL